MKKCLAIASFFALTSIRLAIAIDPAAGAATTYFLRLRRLPKPALRNSIRIPYSASVQTVSIGGQKPGLKSVPASTAEVRS